MSIKHAVIPDLQLKPGVNMTHLPWIGQYLAEKKPDVIIQIGDFFDMPSLSSYDRGKASFEGRRYSKDIEAGNKGLDLLTAPIKAEINRTRRHKSPWKPRLVVTLGNHEQRIQRAIENDSILEGTMGYQDFNFEEWGWEVHAFLEPVWIDGICYSHYFANPLSGRPIGGQSIDTRLKTVGHSFTMGHQQVLMMGCRETLKGRHHGLVAGNCYLHDEGYRGLQGNKEWRGIIMKHEVENGQYDIMTVSLNFLSKKYTGRPLKGHK